MNDDEAALVWTPSARATGNAAITEFARFMWSLRVGGLLRGGTVHCLDGAPTARALWGVAERGRVTHLGVSPGYLSASRDAGLHPAADFDLAALRVVGCTGSVLAAPLHRWAAEELGPEVLVGSTTGGTDVVSGFAGFAPTVPFRAGEIAVRCLGVDLHAWSPEREQLTGEGGACHHLADAVDAARLLGRPGRQPLPRRLLRGVPQSLAATGCRCS